MADFERYEVLRELGQGGMGTVYLARETSGLDRLVVIKAIRQEVIKEELVGDRFMQEARVTAQLVHPNIVEIHDLGQAPTGPYLVMEHVHGPSLEAVLGICKAQGRPVPVAVALQVAAALCNALHCAHTFVDVQGREHCIVHRDLKPQNVLITFTGRIKLIDFGIAKSELSVVKTSSGMIQGTVLYMSPEQARARPVDPRSDIFALGVVLYEMLGGAQPFVRSSLLGTLRAIAEEEVPPPPREGMSEELGRVVLKAIAKDPDLRFDTALAFGFSLEACLASERDRGSRPEDDLEIFLREIFPDQRIDLSTSAPLDSGVTEAPDSPGAGLGTDPTISAETDPPGSVRDAAPEPTDPTISAGSNARDSGSPLGQGMDSGALMSSPATGGRRARALILAAVMAIVSAGATVIVLRVTRAPSGGDHPAGIADQGTLARSALDASRPPSTSAGDAAVAPISTRKESAPDAAALAARPPPLTKPTPIRRRPRQPARDPRSKPGPAPPKTPAPPTPPARRPAGVLHIRTSPFAGIRLGGASRRGTAALTLTEARGTVHISGVFAITLSYRTSQRRLLLTVNSRPWCIAYPAARPPRRVPLHDLAVTGGARKIDFRKPGTDKEMSIWLRFSPAG